MPRRGMLHLSYTSGWPPEVWGTGSFCKSKEVAVLNRVTDTWAWALEINFLFDLVPFSHVSEPPPFRVWSQVWTGVDTLKSKGDKDSYLLSVGAGVYGSALINDRHKKFRSLSNQNAPILKLWRRFMYPPKTLPQQLIIRKQLVQKNW